MNVKRLGMIGGLVALLGAGCDKEVTTVEASCEIAPGVEARLIYHQRAWGEDFFGLEVYLLSSRIATNPPVRATMRLCYGEGCSIQCQDGTKISWDNINMEVRKK